MIKDHEWTGLCETIRRSRNPTDAAKANVVGMLNSAAHKLRSEAHDATDKKVKREKNRKARAVELVIREVLA